MAKLGDISSVWNTIRELNVAEIREQAEEPVTLALVGAPDVRGQLADILRGQPGRFPAASRNALLEFDLVLPRERPTELINANAILLVLDGRGPLAPDAISTADKLALVRQPRIAAIVGTDRVPHTSDGRDPDLGGATVIFLPDLTQQSVHDRLLPAVIEAFPEEMRVAAGRRLPGLRDAVAQSLIGGSAFSNATYALTSGLPEMIPLLNLPLNAADMLVLTKNQALLTYRLGLTYGAPVDFQSQMREILPVIGSGFVWRQIARQLVGLIPGFGIVPKVAVAYAGTYAVGQSASLWYSKGEVLTKTNLRQLYRRAMELGKQRARELVKREDRNGDAPAVGPTVRLEQLPAKPRMSLWERIKGFFRRKPKPPATPRET